MKHTPEEKRTALLTLLISLAIMAVMLAGCSGSRYGCNANMGNLQTRDYLMQAKFWKH